MARQPFQWKKSTLAAAAAIALCLAATGTLAALTGASREREAPAAERAPGVSLHDDFAGGTEKDVYAENSGGEAMLTRIRLTELLRLSTGEVLPAGAADDAGGSGWHRHAPGGRDLADCGFEAHGFYTWGLGGHKLYMPAAESALGQGDYTDEDTYLHPKDVGDTLAVIDYAPLLRSAFSADPDALALLEGWLAGDDTYAQPLQKAIAALPDSLTVLGVLQYEGQSEEEQTRRLGEVRLTAIPGEMVSMEAWLAKGRPLGPFWVMDSDGWCYWAQKLSAGEATGLLMQSCVPTSEEKRGLVYKIRAELDAVTTKPDDINNYLGKNHALGDITEAGIELTILASGSYTYGADGELYLPQGDNTYIHVIKNDGSYANYILGDRICAGADQIPGTADDLRPGQGLAVHEDGTLYRITATDGTWTPPESWAGPYLIREIVSGENGAAYLALEGGGYCCTVASVAPAAPGYQVPATLGLGPYRLAWPGEDGTIGTADDLYNDDFAAVGTPESARFYRRLSQKVYVRVSGLGGTEPALYLSQDGLWYLDREGNYINEADLTPLAGMEGQRYTGPAAPLYYAAGAGCAALETSTFALEAMVGTDQTGTAPLTYNCLTDYSFRFLLGTAFKFTQGSAYLFPSDTGYAASALDPYELTPTGVVRGEDGKFYLRTEVSETAPLLRWYIGPGEDDVLGTADDVRLKAGEDLLIGTADDWDGKFTEQFLVDQGRTPNDLNAGATFTADGRTWIVLSVDGRGNRLIMSQNHIAPYSDLTFGTSNVYQGSVLQSKLKAFTDAKLPTLHPYILDPVTPVETGTWSADMAPQNGALSYALSTQEAPTAFILSQSEYTAYGVAGKTPNNNSGSWFWTRTPGGTGSAAVFYKDSLTTNHYEEKPISQANSSFPAAWVRFSDADHLPAHKPAPLDFLPYGFTGTPGETFTADGAGWIVLNKDDAGNLLIVATEASFGRSQFNESNPDGTPPPYTGSLLESYIQNTVMPKLTRLTPFIQPASFPSRAPSVYDADGVKTAFPLSTADFDACGNKGWLSVGVTVTNDDAYWLRNGPAAGQSYSNCVSAVIPGNRYTHWGVDSELNCRPAMIVNFGSLALPYDFTGLPGDRLYADGYNWVVLAANESGSRMLMTVEQVAEMGARSGSMYGAPAYSETLWVTAGRDAAFTGKLTALKPCARTASIPAEIRYPYLAPWNTITGGISACTGGAEGAVAFVPSAGEYGSYIYGVPGMAKYRTAASTWALRSLYSADSAPSSPGYAVSVNGTDGSPYDAYSNTTEYHPKMALWVDFGLSS